MARARTWAALDPRALSQWLTTLPPGAQRDAAVVPLLESQRAKDPAQTVEWAGTFTDPQLRATQLQATLDAWAKTDPAAAQAAAQSANLPPAQ